MKTYTLVGMKFWHADALVRALPPGEELTLIREPTNAHDPKAVQVQARGIMVGYIGRGQKPLTDEDRKAGRKYVPGDENAPLAELLDSLGTTMTAKLLAGWPPRLEVDH